MVKRSHGQEESWDKQWEKEQSSGATGGQGQGEPGAGGGKKLYKSATDKKILGVCGGLAEYMGIDSTILRLLFLLITVLYGGGILLYIVAGIVIPERPMWG